MILVPASGWAQVGQQRMQRGDTVETQQNRAAHDPVAKLNRALEGAGASALTAAQQEELLSRINEYKSTRDTNANATLSAAKNEVEAAILAKNEAALSAASEIVAGQIAAHAGEKIRELGRFGIQVLNILTPEQVEALRTKYGSTGLVHMLGSLAGPLFHGGHKGCPMCGGGGLK